MFVDVSDVAPQKVLLKAVIVGETGVGKTALTSRYVSRIFKQDKPYRVTLGADYSFKLLEIGDKLVTLQIWDTAGREVYNSLNAQFFRGSNCCVIVYDINSRGSFDALSKWADEFIVESNIVNPEAFPFILLGNKADLDDGASREVSVEQAMDWCRSRGNIPYYETSAKDGRNLDEAFLDIAKIALAIYEKENPEAKMVYRYRPRPRWSSWHSC